MLRLAKSKLSLAAALSLGASGIVVAQPADNPTVAWNLSVWGPPRAFTAGIEALAKYVGKETDGKFTIKIHYGDALSKGPDNLDNIKLGAFEMAQICTGYHPGKHLGINVLDLPGLPLADPEVHCHGARRRLQAPYIVNEFKRWNAMLLMSVLQPQSEFMGVGEPPMKMADFKGMRVRALGGTGAAMKNLGAVPTSVPAPEVYNSLERGVFRAAAFPYTYAFASYKIPEICEVVHDQPVAGRQQLPDHRRPATPSSKLPPQYKELLDKGKAMAYEALIKARAEGGRQEEPRRLGEEGPVGDQLLARRAQDVRGGRGEAGLGAPG